MNVTYVDIDDAELVVDYITNDDVPEDMEGRYVVNITKEALEQLLHKIGFRACS